MTPEVAKDVTALADMTIGELRDKYAEVFDEPTTSRHKDHLRKRIAWGLQARAEGGLSERAKRRAEELADEPALRLRAPNKGTTTSAPERTVTGRLNARHDKRLPFSGSKIRRTYKGRKIEVTVLDDGFEYEGETFGSLSAVAEAVTGSHWNGYHFFGLNKETQ
ncbi:MAG: DUF2924 domain-containing protein [Planctomycetota bacterium]